MERAGMEFIPEFQIKYPEYSVITPHTKLSYTVRSLKVSEEETLKTSLLLPNKLAEHLNQVLFSVIVKKPESIVTYEDFLKGTTTRDRDALMYALYHVTYKDIHNYDVTCSKCETVNTVKVRFGESFSMNAWTATDSILEKEISVPLQMAESVTAIIRQPTLQDEQQLLKDLTFVSDADRDKQVDLLSIKRFEIKLPSMVTGADIIKDRANIKKLYGDLPAPDRKLIEVAYADNFGKYGVYLKSTVVCQKCRFENETEIDLVRQFFRSMYE